VSVHFDQHTLVLALGPMIGWVMLQAGMFKQMLERRNRDRMCPSCGRYQRTCGCS